PRAGSNRPGGKKPQSPAGQIVCAARRKRLENGQGQKREHGKDAPMARFPNTPNFTGVNEPMRYEADVEDLEIEGELPAELNGAFFHVRPDPHFPPKLGDDIYFGGDGAVSAFYFRNGRVDFK